MFEKYHSKVPDTIIFSQRVKKNFPWINVCLYAGCAMSSAKRHSLTCCPRTAEGTGPLGLGGWGMQQVVMDKQIALPPELRMADILAYITGPKGLSPCSWPHCHQYTFINLLFTSPNPAKASVELIFFCSPGTATQEEDRTYIYKPAGAMGQKVVTTAKAWGHPISVQPLGRSVNLGQFIQTKIFRRYPSISDFRTESIHLTARKWSCTTKVSQKN